MTLKQIEEKLFDHPLFAAQIPVQLQLSLPELYINEGRLFVQYRLYRQIYSCGKLLIHAPESQLRLMYPFDRIVYYEEHLNIAQGKTAVPVCTLETEMLLTRGVELFESLYALADRILSQWEAGSPVEGELEVYRDRFQTAVTELGLQDPYGG